MTTPENPIKERTYEAISPTAWGVARRRTYTDIPYAKEIFAELEKIRMAQNETEKSEVYGSSKNSEIAPFFEARYLILNKLLREQGSKHIVELAAGLSSRGLDFTSDPDVTFVELDLPQMTDEKKEIIAKVMEASHVPPRPNLFMESGNALIQDDLLKAVSHAGEGEVTFINEGLLRYLSREEQSTLAKGIHSILKEKGGVWITPDIGMRDAMRHHTNLKLEEKTGTKSFYDNQFKDEQEAKEFFESEGFDVEAHTYHEVENDLVSPARIGISADSVQMLMEWSKVFVMKTR